MSTDNAELEDDSQDHPDIVRQRNEIKDLKKQLKDKTEAAERAEAAERKLAFAEAGIKISDPKMSYFVKGYEGELTAEAITAAAVEAGFLEAPESGVPTEELEAQRRVAEASSGAGSTVTGGEADLRAIREATSEAEVLAAVRKAGVPIAGDAA